MSELEKLVKAVEDLTAEVKKLREQQLPITVSTPSYHPYYPNYLPYYATCNTYGQMHSDTIVYTPTSPNTHG